MKYQLTDVTLELFNGVLAPKDAGVNYNAKCLDTDYGYVIPTCLFHQTTAIRSYFENHRLTGNELNKTFHKSWAKVQTASDMQLVIEQLIHYISTYGTGFQGLTYIPDEKLDLSEAGDLPLFFVVPYSREQLIEKSMSLLGSGTALKQETVEKLLFVLDQLGYDLSNAHIQNKEAVVILANQYGIYPNDPVEMLRYMVYRSTSKTLLIKNKETISGIKSGSYNPKTDIEAYGYQRFAPIFNRFKALFLAYKKFCPALINKIGHLSKTHHAPMIQNPLNFVTSNLIALEDFHWLKNATPFALLRAANACALRMNMYEDQQQSGDESAFTYTVRNGKSWTEEYYVTEQQFRIMNENLSQIITELSDRFKHLRGQKVYIPENIVYGLPTSEKQFCGNIPNGTKIYANNIIAGIYWENGYGSFDLDLSGTDISGEKTGWDACYRRGGKWEFSGDITYAPDGAVEFFNIHATDAKLLLNVNEFSHNYDIPESTYHYKLIIGSGDSADRNYMLNPANLIFSCDMGDIEKRQSTIGYVDSDIKGQFFMINRVENGNRITASGNSNVPILKSYLSKAKNSLTLNNVLFNILDMELVKAPSEDVIDLSPDVLTKETLLGLFNEAK